MGLDMYLSKRTYIGNQYRDADTRTGIKFTPAKRKDGFTDDVTEIDPNRVSEVIESIGYWRKANQIHQWFVDKVQDGEDDCKEYDVTREQLEKLLNTVEMVLAGSKLVKGKIVESYTFDNNGKKVINWEDGKVIEDPTLAMKLLPTQSGLFFGGTEYDEYYLNDLIETKKILTEALKSKSGSFYYRSSW